MYGARELLVQRLGQPSAGRKRSGSLLWFLVGVGTSVLILFQSGYALSTTAIGPPAILILLLLLIGLLLTLFLAPRKQLPRLDHSLAVVVLLSVVSMASSLLYGQGALSSAVLWPLGLVVAFLFTVVIDFETFVNWFIGSMVAFSAVALVAQFVFIWRAVPFPGQTITNVNGADYLNGVAFFFLRQWDGTPSSRSLGPFWEPGLFASFLTIAILLEVGFRASKPRMMIIGVLVLGVVITQSTAGYLLLVPAVLLLAWPRRRSLGGALGVAGAMSALIVLALWETISASLAKRNPDMFGKITSDALVSSTRFGSFGLNLAIFSESPMLGKSFVGADHEYLARMRYWGLDSQTSTSTYLLAAMGIVGIVYTAVWVVGIALNRSLPMSTRVVLLICMLVIINKEPHAHILATLILMFYVLQSVRRPSVAEQNP